MGKYSEEVEEETRPWEPASLLTVNNKDSRFTYRWGRKDNLTKLLAEGWIVVKDTDEEGPTSTLLDGEQKDGTIQKRNLILLRMPKERAESRKAYFAKKSASLLESTQQEVVKEVRDQGSSTYGEGAKLE